MSHSYIDIAQFEGANAAEIEFAKRHMRMESGEFDTGERWWQPYMCKFKISRARFVRRYHEKTEAEFEAFMFVRNLLGMVRDVLMLNAVQCTPAPASGSGNPSFCESPPPPSVKGYTLRLEADGLLIEAEFPSQGELMEFYEAFQRLGLTIRRPAAPHGDAPAVPKVEVSKTLTGRFFATGRVGGELYHETGESPAAAIGEWATKSGAVKVTNLY